MFLPVLRIRIREMYLFDPWIRDPGSGMGESQHQDPGPGIWDEQPGSYFLELGNHFFAFLMRIRDPGWRQFGSGIRDGKKSLLCL